MNTVKLQDVKSTHRNPLHSYTPTMRKQKEKLRKQFHSSLQWKEEKAIKGIQNRNKEAKLSLFADNMIPYIENPKDTTWKLLELINEYSKVEGYKINTKKSLAFLYTNNEKTEREIKETISFTITMKRIKYLGINLPKETKDLYIENCKTLMKEIKMTQID